MCVATNRKTRCRPSKGRRCIPDVVLTKLGWFLFSGYGQTDRILESSYGNLSAHKIFKKKLLDGNYTKIWKGKQLWKKTKVGTHLHMLFNHIGLRYPGFGPIHRRRSVQQDCHPLVHSKVICIQEQRLLSITKSFFDQTITLGAQRIGSSCQAPQ